MNSDFVARRKTSIIISNRRLSFPESSVTDDHPSPTPLEHQKCSPSQSERVLAELDYYYQLAKRQLIRYQGTLTGLFPAVSTDQVGSVRDSIYCAIALWSLHLAYRRLDYDKGRSVELKGHIVNCLRGILICWMKQSDSLEKFKNTQNPQNALSVKFHLISGLPIGESFFHHQMDVISLFLLTVTAVINSGLLIIYSMDEVNFLQNLIYYIERSYRTPDLGMWERGSVSHNGTPEIHASTIGMAKSALEAVNGFNCYGERGSARTRLFSDIDALHRNRCIFETLLPRESASKNIDMALFLSLSFPSFSSHNEGILSEVRETIRKELEGEYGVKRFSRDGFLTETSHERESLLGSPTFGLCASSSSYYPPGILHEFDGIESQFPFFYLFFIIDGVFRGNQNEVHKYQEELLKRIVYISNEDEDDFEEPLIPLAFTVPFSSQNDEKSNPGSTVRVPTRIGCEKGLHALWPQSLLILSELLTNHLIDPCEIDPLRRSLPKWNRPQHGFRSLANEKQFGFSTLYDSVVQIVLISESDRLKSLLETYGIETQTPGEIEPLQIWPQSEIVKVYQRLGANKKLGLKGRPVRPLGSLGTSKMYRVNGQIVLCYPLLFSPSQFYYSYDMAILTDDIKGELKFVGQRWRLSGRPTMCIIILEDYLKDKKCSGNILHLLTKFREDSVEGIKIRLGRIQNMVETSCVEHLDFLDSEDLETLQISPFKQLSQKRDDFTSLLFTMHKQNPFILEEYINFVDKYKDRPTEEIVSVFRESTNKYGQVQLLGILLQREGQHFKIDETTSVQEHLENLNRRLGELRYWAPLRYSASLLRQTSDSISPHLAQILVRGTNVFIGAMGGTQILLDKPLTPDEIKSVLYSKVQPHCVLSSVLQQEVLVIVAKLIGNDSEILSGILSLRICWTLRAVEYYYERKDPKSEPLESLSPSRLRQCLFNALSESYEYQTHYLPSPRPKSSFVSSLSVYEIRTINGCLLRVPKDFYDHMWLILERTPLGIYIGDEHLSQNPTLIHHKRGQINFARQIEEMLHGLKSHAEPAVSALVIELFCVIYTILHRNPELYYREKCCALTIVYSAIDIFNNDQVNDSPESFLALPVSQTSGYLARAVVNNILKGSILDRKNISDYDCAVQ